jgi:Tfp pilus assembly protein PilO
MTREQQMLGIAGLVAVLLLVLFFVFLWRPQSERIAEIDAERESVEQQQVTLQQRIARLEDVRRAAPEYEAQIVAAESVVPRETAMPPAFRQLQTAADDAGVELVTITPSRPTQVEGAEEGLAAIALALEVSGEYFELVDFLRRLEDPAITARGVVWSTLALSPIDYPELVLNVNGTMYALLPEADLVERREPPPDEDEDEDEDVDVEVDIEEEDGS